MKNRKIRYILAIIISLMPTSKLRVFLYRVLFGYRISNSYVGWATILVADDVEITGCTIGRNNRFVGPMRIRICERSNIGNENSFSCGWWAKEEKFKSANYDRLLHIGTETLITSNHHFDIVGAFVLGNNSWVAGRGSQFWTHGAGVLERNISIGERCYIGSAVRFSPGSSVGDNTVVGLGSVVTKEFNTTSVIIAGHPAIIIRENYDWK
jgi:acetyltransferase-like isoleucine patch superfamily enzyme